MNPNPALLNKCLDTQYRFSCGVMTLRRFISTQNVTAKSTWVSYYTKRRVHLEYKPLAKPKTIYCIHYGDGRSMVDVPKRVYDSLDLPESIHDDQNDKARWQADQRDLHRQSTSSWLRGD